MTSYNQYYLNKWTHNAKLIHNWNQTSRICSGSQKLDLGTSLQSPKIDLAEWFVKGLQQSKHILWCQHSFLGSTPNFYLLIQALPAWSPASVSPLIILFPSLLPFAQPITLAHVDENKFNEQFNLPRSAGANHTNTYSKIVHNLV